MTDCFIGGSGKDYSWCMVSDCPFVVRDKQEIKFIGVKTMEEAAKYHESDARYDVYVWASGRWEKVDFIVSNGKPKSSMGFKPSEESKSN
jgi:hypothetical protein